MLAEVVRCNLNFSQAAKNLGVSQAYVWQLAHDMFPRGSIALRDNEFRSIFLKNPLASNSEISYNYGYDLDTVRRKRIKLVGIKNVCRLCRKPINIKDAAKKFHKRCLRMRGDSK